MSHIRYNGVILWNGVTVDWSSVGTWLDRCSAPCSRMWARGLFIIAYRPNHVVCYARFCSVKWELVEDSIEGHEIRDGNDVWRGFMSGEAPMWHMKLSLAKGGSKGGSLSRGKVGWVRAGFGWYAEAGGVGTEFIKKILSFWYFYNAYLYLLLALLL